MSCGYQFSQLYLQKKVEVRRRQEDQTMELMVSHTNAGNDRDTKTLCSHFVVKHGPISFESGESFGSRDIDRGSKQELGYGRNGADFYLAYFGSPSKILGRTGCDDRHFHCLSEGVILIC